MAKQKKHSTKQISLILAACFVSVIVLLILLEVTNVTHFYTKDRPISKPVTAFDTSTPEQKEQDAETNAANKKDIAEKNDGQPEHSTDTNTDKSIAMSAQKETNGSVTVFTKLYAYSSGTCSLIATNGSSTATYNADVIYAPEYSSCAGFSIPISSLGAGDWTLNLSVTSNGSTATKSIMYKVM
jgi:hypothetical protein